MHKNCFYSWGSLNKSKVKYWFLHGCFCIIFFVLCVQIRGAYMDMKKNYGGGMINFHVRLNIRSSGIFQLEVDKQLHALAVTSQAQKMVELRTLVSFDWTASWTLESCFLSPPHGGRGKRCCLWVCRYILCRKKKTQLNWIRKLSLQVWICNSYKWYIALKRCPWQNVREEWLKRRWLLNLQ